MAVVGTIGLFLGNFTPENWMPCDGRELTQAAYPDLCNVMRNNAYKAFTRTGVKLPLIDHAEVVGSSVRLAHFICVKGETANRSILFDECSPYEAIKLDKIPCGFVFVIDNVNTILASNFCKQQDMSQLESVCGAHWSHTVVSAMSDRTCIFSGKVGIGFEARNKWPKCKSIAQIRAEAANCPDGEAEIGVKYSK